MYTDLEINLIWASVAVTTLLNISVEIDSLPFRIVSALAYVGCFICTMLFGFTLAAAYSTAEYDENIRKGSEP